MTIAAVLAFAAAWAFALPTPRAVRDRSTHMRHLLLVALLWSAPVLAQRGTTHGATGTMISNRADPRTSGTPDWRWMTASIRATEALQRNFWRGHGRAVQRDGDHGRVQRDQFRERDGRAAFGREVREPPT